ncbi:MAG: class I SAM-dependent methyltransferase [Acholeplasmataceae bacterium]
MYHLLSKYYDQLFKFNPKLKDFLFPYITKSGQALDLGCGTGRLTDMIDQLNMHVKGIDLDAHMIEIAAHKYPHIEFKSEDMIDYMKNPNQSYDLITCFGNTIVHLDNHLLNQLFTQVNLLLNHQKYFIVQLLNYQKILFEKPDSLPDLLTDDLLLKRNYSYFKDYILFQTVLFENDNVYELGETKLYPYTHHQLIDVALQHGFETEVFSDLSFSPYQFDQSHVYLVFKKI